MELSKQALLVHGSQSLSLHLTVCQIQDVDTADAGKWSSGKGGVQNLNQNKMIIIIINLTEIFLNPGLNPSHRDQMYQKIFLMLKKACLRLLNVA